MAMFRAGVGRGGAINKWHLTRGLEKKACSKTVLGLHTDPEKKVNVPSHGGENTGKGSNLKMIVRSHAWSRFT